MIAQREETTRRPIYSIPGLIELEEEFDQVMFTGSYNPSRLSDAYLPRVRRRNITDNEQKKDINSLKLYYLTQTHNSSSWIGTPKYNFLTSSAQNNLTLSARAVLNTASNRQVAEQANKILDVLENELQNFDTSTLPSIRITELDDTRIMIEWIFDNFRMGFNLELNTEESGYFLVSDKATGEIRTASYLKGLKLNTLIQSALVLIINN